MEGSGTDSNEMAPVWLWTGDGVAGVWVINLPRRLASSAMLASLAALADVEADVELAVDVPWRRIEAN